MYGYTQTLKMTLFGAEFILPDSYYWLGAPDNQTHMNRQEIDTDVAIVKARKKISDSMLYSILDK
jgi:hypothetical protein